MKRFYVMCFFLYTYFTSPLMAMEPVALTQMEPEQIQSTVTRIQSTVTRITAQVTGLIKDKDYKHLLRELCLYSWMLEALGREMEDLCSYAKTENTEPIDQKLINKELIDITQKLAKIATRLDTVVMLQEASQYDEPLPDRKQLNRDEYSKRAKKSHHSH